MTSPPALDRRPITALVTGGGGFVGRAVVDQLLARGDKVRSLARGTYPKLAEAGVDVLRGDIADARIVGQACAGCDVVFHIAAKAGIWGAYRGYHEANVIGTRNILAACRQHGVGRLVFTSSPSVIFDGRSMAGVDESVRYPARHHSHYGATKALAEQAVLAANDATLRTVALRPHLIWGPRDNHITPRLLRQARAGTLRRVGDGSNLVDTTYVDDAARAHLLAADALDRNPLAAGRPFFISQGEPTSLWDLIDRILAAAGLPPVARAVPTPVAWTAGAILEAAYSVLPLRGEPRLTRFLAAQFATSHYFDHSKAARDFGYDPAVDNEEGLRRTVAWWEESQAGDA